MQLLIMILKDLKNHLWSYTYATEHISDIFDIEFCTSFQKQAVHLIDLGPHSIQISIEFLRIGLCAGSSARNVIPFLRLTIATHVHFATGAID
jgi:hypothetical protein